MAAAEEVDGSRNGIKPEGGAVKRNEGLHSFRRGKMNRLIRRTKGYSKREGALREALPPAWIRQGLI